MKRKHLQTSYSRRLVAKSSASRSGVFHFSDPPAYCWTCRGRSLHTDISKQMGQKNCLIRNQHSQKAKHLKVVRCGQEKLLGKVTRLALTDEVGDRDGLADGA